MKPLKIVIANSVGRDAQGRHFIHFPSRWTALISGHKAFTYYPYELAYLSSLLKRDAAYHVRMFDGNLLQLNAPQYFEMLKGEKPDYLIMETSTVVYPEDLKLALLLKSFCGTKIIFAGQHPTAMPEEVLRDGVDLVCLGEYEKTLLEYFTNGGNPHIAGIYPHGYNKLLDLDGLPFPEDEDIKRNRYYYIGGSEYREIEMFATRGCPMKCNFCVCGNLYYHPDLFNYRVRRVESVIGEIKYLKGRYPEMEGIFYDEEYHNFNKKFILDLCEAKIASGLNRLKYDAMCGYWTLDEELLRKMKEAGYYKLRIGVETVSEAALRAIQKNVDLSRLEIVLRLAKELGIKMYGTFTFGSLGSDDAGDKKTLAFIEKCLSKNWLSDYQISVCTPEPGTPFYRQLKEKGWLKTEDFARYNGGTAVFSYPNYPREQIEKNFLAAHYLYVKSMLLSRRIFSEIIRSVKRYGFIETLFYGLRTLRDFRW